MDMKSQAIEKLMGVLDELLGGDAKARMKAALEKSEGEEGAKLEVELPEGPEIEVPEGEMGESDEDMPMDEKMPEMKGPLKGLAIKETEVAALPKPSLMKKMRGKV